ncbi:uncharacterized protein LOC116288559 [Actinia tenebrosa]|uniref:Uncharacterized protein LOC116288559 n=1 Tax=Actinia tenebrosa TaxID=6105 RepID=A0A6P8H4E6_ACTTE|nr:uncharacterized protein LOC116288559 [Actinia tenebrosa]XP_031551222.1 uncharacterized protein LOC116288559 [Actinia tenebrosa]XP_031551223.1 uncharacterized protein LOC116288559 [Actinia tenebrosa]XP_031551224.1 uncharacterized protein LOC116288559 [Actinia tenebrosa]
MRLERKPFIYWFNSKPDPEYPQTNDNTASEFVVQLPIGWHLPGVWSVEIQAIMTPETTQTKGDLLLYTNLIRYEIVGHDYFPLIERITTSSAQSIRYQESKHPFRRRVNRSYLESVGFKLADTKGRPPVWLKDRPTKDTTLCLLFTPQVDEYDSSSMSLTLLSNQSKPRFPSNRPGNFTGELPASQRMSDQWRVGMTKVTLPPVASTSKSTQWTFRLDAGGYLKSKLPPGAQHTFTLDNVNSSQDLCAQFKRGVDVVFDSWFPQTQEKPSNGGVGGRGDGAGIGGMQLNQTATWVDDSSGKDVLIAIDLEGRKSLDDLWDRFSANGITMGSDQTKTKWDFTSRHSVLVGPNAPTNNEVMQRLGFWTRDANIAIPGTLQQDGTTQWHSFLSPFVNDFKQDHSYVYLVQTSLELSTFNRFYLKMGFFERLGTLDDPMDPTGPTSTTVTPSELYLTMPKGF